MKQALTETQKYEGRKAYGRLHYRKSKASISFYFHGIAGLEPEHRFHPDRRWRFDLAIPALKIAIEQEGGVWANGRHNRPSGYVKDMEKYNEAAILGWRVLRFTPSQIKSGEAYLTVKRCMSHSS